MEFTKDSQFFFFSREEWAASKKGKTIDWLGLIFEIERNELREYGGIGREKVFLK